MRPEPALTAPQAPDYEGLTAEAALRRAIEADFPGAVALVSSFGAESAVLLHMVARIDPATPVLFGQTGMLFPETLAYQTRLAQDLGLRDVRALIPDWADIARRDPGGRLHADDPDACCRMRKVAPLERALAPFAAWITGRKRAQSATRAALAAAELDAGGRVKINPLADWSMDDVRAYMAAHALPPHPLAARGYVSIGCAPCTTPVAAGEDPRAGRWRGRDKQECGIHVVDGRVTRAPLGAPLDRM